MPKQIVTYGSVIEFLDYDSDTGIFTWKPRHRKHFKGSQGFKMWNTRYCGMVAGCDHGEGYRQIGLFGTPYLAHRIAWLHYYGEWPEFEIDHINHNRSANWIANLRDGTGQENHKNMKLDCRNTSGITGVYWDKWTGRWASKIGIEGKVVHLGRFDAIVEAAKARQAANEKYGFHENHGRA